MNCHGRLILPFLFSAAVLAFAGCTASEEERVTAVFYAYKDALTNDRGEDASTLLSESTHDYFDAMRHLALYAPADELRQRSTVDLTMAVSMRHRIAAEQLRKMSAAEIVVYAVNHGWVGKDGFAPVVVRDVQVADDAALVDCIAEGEPEGEPFHLRKEEGAWRIDLVPLLESASDELDYLAEQQGMTREELILGILFQLTGKPVDESIWEPPLADPISE